MRLALVGPFPPFRGGIAQFTDMLSSAFERYGDTVERISYRRLYPSLIFPGKSQTDLESPCPHKSLPLMDSVLPNRWAQARKRIRSLNPDGILTQWWHPFFAPGLIRSLPPEIPSGAICHNILPHESFPMAKWLTRRFLKRNDLIVTHSNTDRIMAQELSGRDCLLRLYLPLYDQYLESPISRAEARRELGYGEGDRVLLFFGLIRPYKGLADLIEAAEMMGTEIKLLIVGECYSGCRELEQRLENSSLEERVVWVDEFVPDTEVARFFRAADLVVLPYRHSTQSAVAQTALAFRKPLVLTETGGLSEVVDEGSTGFLVPPEDPAALAEGILRGIELARETGLGERIAAKAGQFSWDEYVRRVRDRWP